jgi:hypothetical protein
MGKEIANLSLEVKNRSIYKLCRDVTKPPKKLNLFFERVFPSRRNSNSRRLNKNISTTKRPN